VPVRTARRACLVAVALVASVLATPAAAAVTCTFAGTTVTITLGDGDTATIARSGDEITVSGMSCTPAASVNTADTIMVTGTGSSTVVIDLSAGQFIPGATAEASGESEIEFQVDLPASGTLRVAGGSNQDRIVVGGAGINLNAGEATADVDVSITGSPSIAVEGAEGDDVLSLAGGAVEGSAVQGVTLRGGAGDDMLRAALGPNTFEGGDGSDTIDYSATAQVGLVNLSGGTTLHVDGSVDTLRTIENVIGSPGDDRIVGDAADNLLSGGAGDDAIDGGAGDDDLDGDGGEDTVEFRTAQGVEVDLAAGTATGAGEDTLTGFENVTGSDQADTILGDGGPNLLRGLFGRDTVDGRGGDDVVRGGKGGDRLFGGSGDDLLQAGHGRDQLDGGRGEDVCRGSRDPDSFVRCENYPTRG